MSKRRAVSNISANERDDSPPRRRIVVEMPKVALALIATALTVSACGSSHRSSPVRPVPKTLASQAGEAAVKARTDAAIARVQAAAGAGGAFRMFPHTQGHVACRIPAALSLGIRGICETRVSFRGADSRPVVTFTELWSARLFRTGGSPNRILQHSWRFEVGPNGIRGLGDRGALPPQAAD